MTSTTIGLAVRTLCLVLGLSACGTASKSVPGSLCPNCIAGGETTDFEGEVVCVADNITPVEWDDPLATEFGVDGIMQWLEQPRQMSFGWRRQTGGSVVTGYQRETDLKLEIEVLGLSHGERIPVSTSSTVACPGDFMLLDARVQLATADGALSGTFERPLRLERDADTVYLGALGIEKSEPPIELRDFTGTLDLGLATERAHSGVVALSFSAGLERLRGSLEIVIRYEGEGDEQDTSLAPLRAQWPSDGCETGSIPVDSDQPINLVDGRSPRNYLEQVAGNIAESFPVSALWLDGGETDIDLELGEIDVVCQNLGAPTSYGVAVPLAIRSADRRLATTQLAVLGFRTDEQLDETVMVRSEWTASAALQDQLSVAEMEWANDFEATFELFSRRSVGGQPHGDLQIIGYDGERHNRLYLHWCSGADCSGFPSPKD